MSDERISAREAEELAVCFAADARDLFGYACVLARGDRALADDLVQAAFEAAGRAWPGLRCLADDQRRGWLRATLANVAVSGFRREAAFRDRLARIAADASEADWVQRVGVAVALTGTRPRPSPDDLHQPRSLASALV